MYKKLVDVSAPLLAKGLPQGADDPQYPTLRYGLMVFYINAAKTLLLALLCVLLGIWREALLLCAAYGAMRSVSFGIHFQKTLACTLHGLTFLLGGTLLAIRFPMNATVMAFLLLLCFFIYRQYAPAPTKKRPMSAEKRRAFRAKTLFVFGGITAAAVLLAFGHSTAAGLLVTGVGLQALNILPVWFHILKC